MSRADEMDQIEELRELTRQNNDLLRSMHRNQVTGRLFKLIIWVVILVVIPYYVWQYVQPYVNQASQVYQSASQKAEGISTQMQSVQKSMEGVQQAASGAESFFGSILKRFGF